MRKACATVVGVMWIGLATALAEAQAPLHDSQYADADIAYGAALYASKSTDGGHTWSTPVQFGTLANAVCMFPPDCFNLSGGGFRTGGSYPAPSFDTARNRLLVAIADIAGTYAQTYLYTLNPATLQPTRARQRTRAVAAPAMLPATRARV